jgi:hypothetical protein
MAQRAHDRAHPTVADDGAYGTEDRLLRDEPLDPRIRRALQRPGIDVPAHRQEKVEIGAVRGEQQLLEGGVDAVEDRAERRVHERSGSGSCGHPLGGGLSRGHGRGGEELQDLASVRPLREPAGREVVEEHSMVEDREVRIRSRCQRGERVSRPMPQQAQRRMKRDPVDHAARADQPCVDGTGEFGDLTDNDVGLPLESQQVVEKLLTQAGETGHLPGSAGGGETRHGPLGLRLEPVPPDGQGVKTGLGNLRCEARRRRHLDVVPAVLQPAGEPDHRVQVAGARLYGKEDGPHSRNLQRSRSTDRPRSSAR